MADLDLTQFDGHTPGPWRWEFNAKNHHVGLVGGVPAYDLTVMDFARWGMGGAQPVFLEPGTMPTLHRLSDRADWLAPIAGRAHHAHWCSTVAHPDARLMAAAPALLAGVKRQAAEIERLRVALGGLYGSMQRRHYGRMPDEVQKAFDAAREALGAHHG